MRSGRQTSEDRCSSQSPLRSDERVCNTHCLLEWKTSAPSKCSVRCGNGIKRQVTKCIQKKLPMKTYLVTEDHYCIKFGLIKPPPTISCKGECISGRWRYSSWDSCSLPCGGGIRRRTASCVDRSGTSLNRQYCGDILEAMRESCNTEHCPRWSIGEWRSCSTSCARGYQTRVVLCKLGDTVLNDAACTSQMPDKMQSCKQSIPCPQWTYTPWSFCSQSCGVGYQNRRSMCNGIGLCNMDDQAILHQPCPNLLPCVDLTKYEWSFDDWTDCSITCGIEGVKMRSASCKRVDQIGIVDEEFCKELTQPEAVISSCDTDRSCYTGIWITGLWSRCTTTCGDGYKKRAIGCRVNGQYQKDQTSCKRSTRPDDMTKCGNKPCVLDVPTFFQFTKSYSWKALGWSQCSTTCGYSERSRAVICIDESGVTVEDNKCNSQSKSAVTETCETKPCRRFVWGKGKWQPCSSTCGIGKQKRRVFCIRLTGNIRKKSSPKNCKKYTRKMQPERERKCRASKHCVKWKANEWSTCDELCRQKRLIICWERHTKRQLPDEQCVQLPKPKSKRGCKTCAKGNWKITDWSSCSATCRIEDVAPIQTRKVTCLNSDSKQVHTNACKETVRPSKTRECDHAPNCITEWNTSDWGLCSTTCDTGTITRSVTCPTFGNCTSEKPLDTRQCNLGSCVPQSCADIQRINKTNQNGNYNIKVNNHDMTLYCFGMKTTTPKEYINLIAPDNFSIIYRYQLKNTTSCPKSHTNEDLVLRPKIKGGKTVYRKLRYFPKTNRVATNDVLYTKTRGTKINFATAGDCYSSGACPQGGFSINLNGTGFKVSQNQKWRIIGKHGNMELWRSPSGSKIRARCGGLCARCEPSIPNILQLEHVTGNVLT